MHLQAYMLSVLSNISSKEHSICLDDIIPEHDTYAPVLHYGELVFINHVVSCLKILFIRYMNKGRKLLQIPSATSDMSSEYCFV